MFLQSNKLILICLFIFQSCHIKTFIILGQNITRLFQKFSCLMFWFYGAGIKEYGMVPFDPLFIPRMEIGEQTGPVNLKITYLDATQIGMSKMMIDSVS